MSSETNSQNSAAPTDPLELWKLWNETTSKVWLNAVQSSTEATTKSSSLYSSWIQSVGESVNKAQEQVHVNPFQLMNAKDAWKTWFDTTMEIWRKAVQTGGDPLGLTRQWLTLMEEAQQKLIAGSPLQTDPFTLFKEWYDATSEQWSKVVEETLSSKQFLESTRPLLESHASITAAFRHANEEYFKHLQLPTITDVANVAQLVINLEEKVDTIEDSLENFELTNQATLESLAHLEQRLDQVATAEVVASLEQRLNQVATIQMVAGLEQRLNQVESKLDKVLAALEKLEERPAEHTQSSNAARKTPKKSVSQQEVQE